MRNRNDVIILATIATTALGAFGCTSMKRPESIEDKMARYIPKDVNPNGIPDMEIFASDELIAMSTGSHRSQSRSRFPASVETEKDEEGEVSQNQEDLVSNKRLYFMGLYKQYQTLAQYSEREDTPMLEHCPSFHTTLLNDKGYKNGPSHIKIDADERFAHITKADFTLYPELSLPMTADTTHPTLGEYMMENPESSKNESFQVAINTHLSKTYNEIRELCDTGYSSNFYRYENLTRHVKSHHWSYQPGPMPLKTFVKTTVFSNMALIESLHGDIRPARGPASVSGSHESDNYQQGIVKNLGVTWVGQFFKTLPKWRSSKR